MSCVGCSERGCSCFATGPLLLTPHRGDANAVMCVVILGNPFTSVPVLCSVFQVPCGNPSPAPPCLDCSANTLVPSSSVPPQRRVSDCVKHLLEAGADKDAVDDEGFDAVLWAIKGDGAENIPLLEAANVDMNKAVAGEGPHCLPAPSPPPPPSHNHNHNHTRTHTYTHVHTRTHTPRAPTPSHF